MELSQSQCIPCHKGGQALAAHEVQALLASLDGWALNDEGKWLHRTYKFKNFALAMAFANEIGDLAEEQNHHPDMALGWGYVTVCLQTHSVGGLHMNDFIMAAKIDAIQ